MYRINKSLLENLKSFWPGKSGEFHDKVKIASNTWGDYVSSGTLPVQRLVWLCNNLRIPFHYFISTDDAIDLLPTQEDLFRPRGKFSPVIFRTEMLKASVGISSPSKKPLYRMMEELGYKKGVFYLWTDPSRDTLSLDTLLKFCNHFGYEIERFIEDDNPVTSPKRARKSEPKPDYKELCNNLSEEVDKLKKENENLKRKLERLRNVNDKLMRKASAGSDYGQSENISPLAADEPK